ncbi:MAG: M48 family metalloprotease [Desulfobacteraceae bacterium]|nr:M48 family metalloprotease [Desulfobacteraceae bacterium]
MLFLFTVQMVIIWERYHFYQNNIFDGITKKEFIITQLGFALPSLLPWFLISSAFDLLELIPFKHKEIFTESVTGQIIYAALLVFTISAFIPVIIKKFWKCKKIDDLETLEILENLSKHTGVKYKQALLWPIFQGKIITAGVIGLFKNFRYILVTKAFCDYLAPDEKKAVIAHEFGHIKKNHMILYLLIFGGFIICTYSLIEPAAFIFLFLTSNNSNSFIAGNNLMSLFTALSFMGSFILFFRYVFGFFMRNFERQADSYSFTVSGSSFPLVSTFRKISRLSNENDDEPNWHHYSIKERIEFLLKCQMDNSLVKKHDKKVNSSLLIYFFIVSIVFFTGIKSDFYKEIIIKKNAEKIILAELEKNPQSFELYHYLGDLMVELESEEKAVNAYEKALTINENLPETLNNLAWLYITSENKNIQNIDKGLTLIQKACNLKNNPPSYILDTLAEGLFRKNEFDSACYFAKKALEKSGDNKEYYASQVSKICIH